MNKIYAPFKVYGYTNGFHPLVRSFVDVWQKKYPIEILENQKIFSKIVRKISFKLINLKILSGERSDDLNFNIHNLHYLNLTKKYNDEKFFHHTICPPANGKSILHFENPITLFAGDKIHGNFNQGESLTDSPFYKRINKIICSSSVHSIFSHSKTSIISIKNCFPELDVNKLHYVDPLPYIDLMVKKSRVNLCKTDSDADISILFTNSYHAGINSFWLRGGATLLLACDLIKRKYPNLKIKLNIVSGLPSNMNSELNSILLKDWVHVIDRGISDEELQALYDNSDLFICVAAGLHSMSVLRAISSGCYVIASDSPGYSDYINDANGEIIEGSALKIFYHLDRNLNFLLDNYAKVIESNYNNVNALYERISNFIEKYNVKKRNRNISDYNNDINFPKFIDDFLRFDN